MASMLNRCALREGMVFKSGFARLRLKCLFKYTPQLLRLGPTLARHWPLVDDERALRYGSAAQCAAALGCA